MAKYKTLGLVWFDKTQHGGIFHQDWRLADNALAAISFHSACATSSRPPARQLPSGSTE